jgi:hypothetical protein
MASGWLHSSRFRTNVRACAFSCCRKCHLPPSSYTTTFTDPNALFPPIDKTYIAPGGRKPTYLTPSGQTNRDADALMKRNRGAWNPDAYRPLDAFRCVRPSPSPRVPGL